MIKYLGSKRTLLPTIARIAGALPEARSVTDLFSGTSRVGHALKQHGFQVFSNDHNAYAATLARCYVQADLESTERAARSLIDEFNRLPPAPGYFTETFCEKSRFFQPKNGARVDAIREAIQAKSLEPELEAVLLVSLMEAADRVDSTCGVQMAYLKQWAARANNDLSLRLPNVISQPRHGKCQATQADALAAVKNLHSDILYLDPPYNQHSYLGNYHVWESLILWDKPEVYGIACKRVDCRERKSAFNLRPRFYDAFACIIRSASARLIVVSFNNEGYISREEMETLLSERGSVYVIATDYKRYVGAQIGIYSPRGQLVGEVSHLRNVEYLYIVDTQNSGVDWVEMTARLSDAPPETTNASPPSPQRSPNTDFLRLRSLLDERRHLASQDAQRSLGLDAATVRNLFKDLVLAGHARVEGQRRGTVYVSTGASSSPHEEQRETRTVTQQFTLF
jgi:adenine-specific DNA-methyltransferase